MSDESSPLEFPCDFPIKVLGRNAEDFRMAALAIVSTHFSAAEAAPSAEQTSREGRFLSLTFTVRARSRAQLDAAYTELSGHPAVLMVL